MKKVWKRSIAMALVLMFSLTLLFGVTGCGSSGKQEGAASAEQSGSDKAAGDSSTENKAEEPAKGEPVNLKLWVFAEPHAKFFEYVKEEYKKTHPDVTVDIEVSEYNALFDKLTVVANSGGEGAPDMVDVEQGVFGRYIKGDIIFEPLNSYLEKAGKTEALAKGRQALYTWQNNIYGLEHALCPVVLAYRKDIFEENGISVPIKKWTDFTDAGLKLKQKGINITNLSALPGGFKDTLDLIVRSANADIVDTDGNVNVNTEAFVNTAKMLYNWVKVDKIASTFEADQDRFKQMADNKVVTMVAADWGTGWLKDFVPEQKGKWAVTSLPVLNDGDSPTSVSGGTGLAMIKTTKYKDLVWEFMALAQLDKQSAIKRFELTNLFPPLLESYDAPELNQPNEYYGGQVLGKVYAELGKIAPPQQPTWWRHLYAQAFEKYYFDFMNGKITAEDFAKKVEDETKGLIEENK